MITRGERNLARADWPDGERASTSRAASCGGPGAGQSWLSGCGEWEVEKAPEKDQR